MKNRQRNLGIFLISVGIVLLVALVFITFYEAKASPSVCTMAYIRTYVGGQSEHWWGTENMRKYICKMIVYTTDNYQIVFDAPGGGSTVVCNTDMSHRYCAEGFYGRLGHIFRQNPSSPLGQTFVYYTDDVASGAFTYMTIPLILGDFFGSNRPAPTDTPTPTLTKTRTPTTGPTPTRTRTPTKTSTPLPYP